MIDSKVYWNKGKYASLNEPKISEVVKNILKDIDGLLFDNEPELAQEQVELELVPAMRRLVEVNAQGEHD